MQIIFRNFKVKTIIGVYKEERLKETELSIFLKINFDATKATISDKLEDTIDYDKLSQILNDSAKNHYNLIETLAKVIIDNITKNFPNVHDIEVEIIKPNIVSQAESVSVREFYKKK